ncbi:MAG: Na+/H+ antiporter NhaC [Verrucomicrobia bacterium]|nr:Na+/H+ antiporter NhaC [Verrucomicrobiota bacterium]
MESGVITPSAELKRMPHLGHSLLPIVGTAALIGVGFGVFKVRVEVMLVVAAALTGMLANRLGLSWREIQAGMMQSIMKGLPAMLIVVVVGALIASWIAAGTIPMLIYFGLGLISPKMFLVTASLATGIVSLLTGTGYGTIGTVGVAFMGIAHGLGIPPERTAGALVAGAYLGDKISPFAANANFAVAVAQVNIYDHIRHCLWTTVPAFAVGLVVYWIAGAQHEPAALGTVLAGDAIREALAHRFVFNAWLLLPPVLTLGLAIGNRPVLPGMLLAVALAVVLAISVQGMSVVVALNVTVTGYEPRTGLAVVDKLLAQGGMEKMMHVTLIALCAFAFSGILQKAGLLEPVLRLMHTFTHNTRRLVAATALGCLVVELMTGAAFVCILLPSELFGPAYRRLGLAGKNLTRVVGDCGIVGVPLIPWSIAGAFMSGALGVSVTSYAPWAIFCYAGVFFTLLAGFTGFTMAPRKNEDETQPGS